MAKRDIVDVIKELELKVLGFLGYYMSGDEEKEAPWYSLVKVEVLGLHCFCLI